ncbi:sulfur carrier protein ThiS [Alteromonas sp. 345S023]|jgi:sulfur carrier protein|uniref:Sulfur carrier protein ThiS n=1 Tax=Alteromonas profundi TaxID=2696062 RepID=A0A7X5LK50_9ALTE|nr:sulfur carrier protein ThiS [Alteromonas profundi]NDV90454.1 sulfur carrier protein ThiS [Alteromonas profundi]
MTCIHINVNNEALSCISPISISELVALNHLDEEGTAIALNSTIVSKPLWSTTYLSNGDHLDIFTLVAGG